MKASTAVIAAMLAFAASGAARAEQPYERLDSAGAAILIPSLRDQEREEQAAARAFAERRQKMIDECQENHGSEIDCERETDTELRAEGLPWRSRVIRLGPVR
jgi:hypothetical protein